jgi:lipopolysaccharide biosynthesis protein
MKIPVIVWVYHLEVWDELLFLLKRDDVYPIIGLCDTNDNTKVLESIRNFLSQYTIQYFNNKGADIWPFLQQIQKVEEPYFIKVHTKKDKEWRSYLTIDLFNNLQSNIQLLEKNEILQPWNKTSNNDIGMIANTDCIVSNYEHTNTECIKKICNILNIDYSKVKFSRYVSGTMFISRTNIFKKYFHYDVMSELSLLMESGRTDDKIKGTYTHALERVLGYIITNENLRIISSRY